jgi:hypothetical protein
MTEKTGLLSTLENKFTYYLVEKAPFQIPDNAREIIVKIAPWAALVEFVFLIIGLIVIIPALFFILGLGSYISYYGFAYGSAPIFFISNIILLFQLIILGISIPGLFGRKKFAWNLLYYSTLVYFLYRIIYWISVPLHVGILIGALISAIIGLYLIFQVKDYFKN